MNRIANIGLAFAFAVSALTSASLKAQTAAPAPSQPQDQSLGNYARKVQKDPGATKPKPKVFDNDNLPRDEKISIVGAQPSGSAPSAADTKETSKAKPNPTPQTDEARKQAEWKQWQGKISSQKDSIDLASRELDVLQREYQLRAAEMYADAGNRLRNQAAWDKQDADYKQKIADKQKAVDDAKQKLETMQEEARKAGVPSSMID
jgi:hypothetical protein